MKLSEPPVCHQRGKPLHRVFPETPTIAYLIIILFQFLLFINPSHSIEGPIQEPTPVKENVQLREKWGIEVASLRLTAAEHMVDFRYRVIDPKKAVPFLSVNNKPTLIDQATGVKLSVPVAPKIGALRQKTIEPEAGRIYFILFGNPGVVRNGSKVTLVIGDVKVEDLTVEGEAGARP